MNEFRVVLPLPPKELSPNARVHFFAKHKAASAYVERIKVEIANFYPGRTWPVFTRARLAVEFIYGDNRRRDVDNALASLKPMLDQLKALGIIPDDSWQHLCPITASARVDKGSEARVAIHLQGEERTQ